MVYNLAEWSKLCSVSKPAVTQGVKRGLIAKNQDGKIDDTNPVNALYLAQHTTGKKPDPKKQKPEPKPVGMSASEKRKLETISIDVNTALGEAAILPIEKLKSAIALQKSQTKNHEFKFAKGKSEVITKEEFRRVAEAWNTNLSQSVMRVPRRVIARLWSMAKSGSDKIDGERELEKALSAAVTRALEGVANGK